MFLSKLRLYMLGAGLILALFGVDKGKDWIVDTWGDYQQSKAHARELEDVVRRSDHRADQFKRRIDLLEQDAIARKEEVDWARDRVANREKLVADLRQQNHELQKTLDSRIPVNLIR